MTSAQASYRSKAAEQISIKSGDASILAKKDGEFTIKAKDFNLQASGKINAKADSTITLKGSKILQN